MSGQEWAAVHTAGMRMSPDETAAAEAALAADPEDLEARIKLAGRYMIARPELQARRVVHIHWLIEHRPELSLGGHGAIPRFASPDGFERGKALWLAQVAAHPENLAVLENAILFVSRDDPALARELILRGMVLAPSPKWHSEMSDLHWQAWAFASTAAERREHAALVVAQCELALQLEQTSAERDDWQVELARASVEAGYVQKAADAAARIVADLAQADPRRVPRGRYWSAIALGVAALHRNEVGVARTHPRGGCRCGRGVLEPAVRPAGPHARRRAARARRA